jgi:transposase InsO family protein
VNAIVKLRVELSAQGHDAGAATIAYHLAQGHRAVPSLSTIWRILRRDGLVAHEPRKRPRCSLIRFEADLPNDLWQADITAWQLASGQIVEILNLIDDHSRLFLGSDAYARVKAADVVTSFHKAAQLHGLPAALLSDNGGVFTGSCRGGWREIALLRL